MCVQALGSPAANSRAQVLPISSITSSLLPEEAGRSVGKLTDGVVDKAVVGAVECGLDRKASTTASAARTPRVATTSTVSPFRKPQRYEQRWRKDNICPLPRVAALARAALPQAG